MGGIGYVSGAHLKLASLTGQASLAVGRADLVMGDGNAEKFTRSRALYDVLNCAQCPLRAGDWYLVETENQVISQL